MGCFQLISEEDAHFAEDHFLCIVKEAVRTDADAVGLHVVERDQLRHGVGLHVGELAVGSLDPLAVLLYLELVNAASFVLFGVDKLRAKRGRWRIPEAVLILSAVLGGCIGALGGMLLFRHKIRKKKFTVGIPVILAMQIAFFLLIFWTVAH